MTIYRSGKVVPYQNLRRDDLITECEKRGLPFEGREPAADNLRDILVEHDTYVRLHEKFGPKPKKSSKKK